MAEHNIDNGTGKSQTFHELANKSKLRPLECGEIVAVHGQAAQVRNWPPQARHGVHRLRIKWDAPTGRLGKGLEVNPITAMLLKQAQIEKRERRGIRHGDLSLPSAPKAAPQASDEIEE